MSRHDVTVRCRDCKKVQAKIFTKNNHSIVKCWCDEEGTWVNLDFAVPCPNFEERPKEDTYCPVSISYVEPIEPQHAPDEVVE